jgi:hypothetical protein
MVIALPAAKDVDLEAPLPKATPALRHRSALRSLSAPSRFLTDRSVKL